MGFLNRLRTGLARATAACGVPPGQTYPVVGLIRADEFRHGIQLLNDDQTPMLWVVDRLQEHAGLSHGLAAEAVALCHSQGGVLVPAPTRAAAESWATTIGQAARVAGFPLQCQVVGDDPGKPS